MIYLVRALRRRTIGEDDHGETKEDSVEKGHSVQRLVENLRKGGDQSTAAMDRSV